MAWFDWVFIVSITLLAGIAIRAKRQRGQYFSTRDLEGAVMGSPGGSIESGFAVAPQNLRTQKLFVQDAISDGRPGLQAHLNFEGAYYDQPLRRSSTAPGTFSYYRRRFEQMKPLLGLPITFGFLVEADRPYPRGHAQAVSWLAMQIARQAGLSRAEIEEIRLAGLLHDIGKLEVPVCVLKKPALLTPEEFDIMKSHAARGEKMLEPFKVKGIGRIVRHHHERYDGSGYPDGLAGDRIPLGARIVAVAECFEDMVSDLPYKRARTFEDALDELRRCSGTQFDPKVVMTFLDWLQIHGDPREQTAARWSCNSR